MTFRFHTIRILCSFESESGFVGSRNTSAMVSSHWVGPSGQTDGQTVAATVNQRVDGCQQLVHARYHHCTIQHSVNMTRFLLLEWEARLSQTNCATLCQRWRIKQPQNRTNCQFRGVHTSLHSSYLTSPSYVLTLNDLQLPETIQGYQQSTCSLFSR